MIKFNEVMGYLFTESQLQTEKIKMKVAKLCDEDLIWCDECPYEKGKTGCSIVEYLREFTQ